MSFITRDTEPVNSRRESANWASLLGTAARAIDHLEAVAPELVRPAAETRQPLVETSAPQVETPTPTPVRQEPAPAERVVTTGHQANIAELVRLANQEAMSASEIAPEEFNKN